MLGAMEGGEQAYMDVFTAVFGHTTHTVAAITKAGQPRVFET